MIVLLDNGHGGIVNGEYQTTGKRSPIWDDGSQLFEGEFNRAIVNRIIERLTSLNINYVQFLLNIEMLRFLLGLKEPINIVMNLVFLLVFTQMQEGDTVLRFLLPPEILEAIP